MQSYLNKTKKELQASLASSAMGYFELGINLFNKASPSSSILSEIQPIVGNLSISIELMLKTFLFSKNPNLVFSNFPLQLRIAFTCPDDIVKEFNWRQYDADLKSFTFKTYQVDELIASFYIFHPVLKKELHPFFNFFSKCRNINVHGSSVSVQRYDLERTAYLAMRIFKELYAIKMFGLYGDRLLNSVNDILKSLDAERATKVKRKIDEATKVSRSMSDETVYVSVEGWDNYVTECPVCSSEGILDGFTDADSYSPADTDIYFAADSFECAECKLTLDDTKEMELAGMETIYDRNDDIDEWSDYRYSIYDGS